MEAKSIEKLILGSEIIFDRKLSNDEIIDLMFVLMPSYIKNKLNKSYVQNGRKTLKKQLDAEIAAKRIKEKKEKIMKTINYTIDYYDDVEESKIDDPKAIQEIVNFLHDEAGEESFKILKEEKEITLLGMYFENEKGEQILFDAKVFYEEKK